VTLIVFEDKLTREQIEFVRKTVRKAQKNNEVLVFHNSRVKVWQIDDPAIEIQYEPSPSASSAEEGNE